MSSMNVKIFLEQGLNKSKIAWVKMDPYGFSGILLLFLLYLSQFVKEYLDR